MWSAPASQETLFGAAAKVAASVDRQDQPDPVADLRGQVARLAAWVRQARRVRAVLPALQVLRDRWGSKDSTVQLARQARADQAGLWDLLGRRESREWSVRRDQADQTARQVLKVTPGRLARLALPDLLALLALLVPRGMWARLDLRDRRAALGRVALLDRQEA